MSEPAQESHETTPAPPGARRIAWGGLSFCVPSNWELASYRFLSKGVSRIELEDEYTVRVEAEWVQCRHQLKLDRIMKRYEKASKPLTLKSDEREEIGGLPPEWHATRFVFRETGVDEKEPDLHVTRHEMVTAFYVCPRSSLFCFFILHLLPEDPEDLVAVVRQLAETFHDHTEQEVIPWEMFDISFGMPREFSLKRANFDIGVKSLEFGWRLRRFYVWYFSCADMFLKDGHSPAEWAAGYLNKFAGLRGPVFHVANGRITWKRRMPHVLGHRTEIAHMCFCYSPEYRLVEDKNRLVVSVYQYRTRGDLEILAGTQLPTPR